MWGVAAARDVGRRILLAHGATGLGAAGHNLWGAPSLAVVVPRWYPLQSLVAPDRVATEATVERWPMSRLFHSRVYGSMNKRRRRALGLGRYSREAVWAGMAAEEARLTALALAARRRARPWWRRLVDRVWLALVWLWVRLSGAGRTHSPSRGLSASPRGTRAARRGP